MRQTALIFASTAVLGAAGLSALTAQQAVGLFEVRTRAQIDVALAGVDSEWTTITVDGLRVNFFGTAPDEPQRFAVLEALSGTIAGPRIRDHSILAGEDATTTPEFSFEIIRNGTVFSLVGQVPQSVGAAALEDGLARIPDADVTDMLVSQDYDPPEGWRASLQLALDAVKLFDHGTIKVRAGEVSVTAVASDPDARKEMREAITAQRPKSVKLDIQIEAPLPTIAPFVFAFAGNGDTGRMSRCSAPSDEAVERLTAALADWNAGGECAVGLGAPSPQWDSALIASLKTLKTIGGGALVVEDADVRLTALPGADAVVFQAATDGLSAALPDIFTLHTTLPPLPAPDEVAPEPARLAAERTEKGTVIVTGDLPDGMLSRAAETFAEAKFGFNQVDVQTVARDDLPTGWSNRVLAGLEALALLNVGRVEVTEDSITLTGEAQTDDIEGAMKAILSVRLPEETTVTMDILVNPREVLPLVSEKRAELCEAQIASLLTNAQIVFPPGGTDIDADSMAIVDGVAAILKECPGAHFEIGGHTDAQGRETSNLAISQSRAAAVMDALLARGTDSVFLVAKGYGETAPIGDNETEDGRAMNRRIEFKLIVEGDDLPPPSTADADDEIEDDPTISAQATADANTESNADDADGSTTIDADAETGSGAAIDSEASVDTNTEGATDDANTEDNADTTASDATAEDATVDPDFTDETDEFEGPANDDDTLLRPRPRELN